MRKKKVILIIGGHDPTGGAGITADIETANHFNCHPLSILTCTTIQDTSGVTKISNMPKDYIYKCFDKLINEFKVNVIKIGLIPSLTASKEILKILSNKKIKNIPSEEKPDNWNIRYPNNSYALNFWTLEPGITDNDTTFPAVDTIFHTLGFDEQMIMIDFTNNMLVLRFSLYELSLNYNVERKYKDNDQYATSNYILSLPGGIGLGGIQNYKPYDFLYDVTQSIDLN